MNLGFSTANSGQTKTPRLSKMVAKDVKEYAYLLFCVENTGGACILPRFCLYQMLKGEERHAERLSILM